MSAQGDNYLDKAAYCDRMASIATDTNAKARFTDAAKRWRDAARRRQRLEDDLAKVPKSD